MTDRVPEIRFLGIRNQPKNGFKASLSRLFFIFCQIFAIFGKIIKYAKKLAKNEKKSLVKLAISLLPKPETGYYTRSVTNREHYKYFIEFLNAARSFSS